jgi:PelA/Pel-15E family pectate lyase
VGTLDNDATTTELSFLALVAAQTPGADPYRKAFTRGIEYLLAAQFPNGGWPQVWPLEGGYHDAITFNDNAVTEAAAVLTEVAGHRFPWVGDELCSRAANAASRALGSILATQVEVHGKLTLWAQQHDALTLAPVSGRNFEPPALATGESADILLYLMGLPHPGKDVAAAIAAGIATLKSSAVYGQDWPAGRPAEGGRRLTPKPGAGPIWPRYLSLTTLKPIFGDRDKTIHDGVNELSLERRNGYSWYSAGPQRALDAYAAWTGTHPLP